jgi:hypothetical protein
MSTTLITFIIIACIVTVVVINRLMIKEEDLIKKAEKNWFYHVLAKMTSGKYEGYTLSEEGKKALNEFISKPSVHDKHPIGSYFRLRDSLKDTLFTCANFHNYKLSFNLGEVGVGVCIMLLFICVVTLGVVLC